LAINDYQTGIGELAFPKWIGQLFPAIQIEATNRANRRKKKRSQESRFVFVRAVGD
jgi:hypothetical protein